MPAKFVLTRRGDSFHWNLLATNGKVVASSETYNTKRAALAGIESLRKNASGAALDDQTAASAAVPRSVGESAPARKPTAAAAKAAKIVPARKPPAKRSASPRRSASDIS